MLSLEQFPNDRLASRLVLLLQLIPVTEYISRRPQPLPTAMLHHQCSSQKLRMSGGKGAQGYSVGITNTCSVLSSNIFVIRMVFDQ